MAQALSIRLPAFEFTLPRRRIAALREAADRGVLTLLRLGLVLFVTYDGALIVRNITRALCDTSGHTAPTWTAH